MFAEGEPISFEAGWQKLLDEGFRKVEKYLAVGEGRRNRLSMTKKEPQLFTYQEHSDLYTMVYTMATQRSPHNWSCQLYTKYVETIGDYVAATVVPAVQGLHGDELLVEMWHRLEDHRLYVTWMVRLFQYLDRFYVRLQSQEWLKHKGMTIFEQEALVPVEKEVHAAFREKVRQDRQGCPVNYQVLHGIVAMFMWLDGGCWKIYGRVMDDCVMPDTHAHYQAKAAEWIAGENFTDYLRHAENALTAEANRCSNYLEASTGDALRQCVVGALLTEPLNDLLGKDPGFAHLVQQKHYQDLKTVNHLFGLFDGGIERIAKEFRAVVQTHGAALTRDYIQPNATPQYSHGPKFIREAANLHSHYKEMIDSCFIIGDIAKSTDIRMQKALKDAFHAFLNENHCRVLFPAFLAAHCDRFLRKHAKEPFDEEQLNYLLNSAVHLFDYATEKDIFASHARMFLAKRLLYDHSVSSVVENRLLTKLRQKCGCQFTSKQEGMLADLSAAEATQTAFTNQFNIAELPFEFTVQTLTKGYWPTYTSTHMRLPKTLQAQLDRFTTYYATETQHRKLTWLHSLGTMTLSGFFSNTPIEVICNTAQGCLLLLFNESKTLSIAHIANLLDLELPDAKTLVASLFIGKHPILFCTTGEAPKSALELDQNSAFALNESYVQSARRIKLTSAPPEETTFKETARADNSVAVEAALVRIMKSHKVLSHKQLVEKVMEALPNFEVTPPVIKSRVERLLEREYLERDAEHVTMYKYVA